MRVFITGANGYVGAPLVRALTQAGHQVTGLVRAATRGQQIVGYGAALAEGDIKQPDGWAPLAAEHDAVIHAAMEYGPSTVAADRTVIDALLARLRLAGAPRQLVYTSGVWVLGDTGDTAVDETAAVDHPTAAVAWRPAHERLVLEADSPALATAVVRPGMVWGGTAGLVSAFFITARDEGAASYVGDGANRWPLIHRDDLANAYKAILEQRARGVFHAVDGAAVPTRDIARAASEAAGKGGKTRSIPRDEARAKMGPMADALCLDQVVTARRTLALGWRPTHPFFPEAARLAWQELTRGA